GHLFRTLGVSVARRGLPPPRRKGARALNRSAPIRFTREINRDTSGTPRRSVFLITWFLGLYRPNPILVAAPVAHPPRRRNRFGHHRGHHRCHCSPGHSAAR